MKAISAMTAMILAACGGDSGASKEDATQAFAAATVAMSTALSKAVSGSAGATAETITLNYSGACTLGGTVGVTGTYDSSGTGTSAAFEINAQFMQCKEATGTIDGDMHWVSTVNGQTYSATMTGDLDWTGQNGSASCEYNLSVSVTQGSLSYSGTVCGYSVQELQGR